MNAPRNVALLGATGSIGRSALSVFEAFPDRFRVVSMSAGTNLEALLPAIARFRPSVVSVKERSDAERVRREFPGVRVGYGEQGIVDVATLPEVDVVLGGVVGAAGLPPAYEAVKLGKTLALANKEVLVVAGEAVMAAAAASGAAVLPVDSEHCALHQALRCGRPSEVERLVLTASGGPFRTRALETFDAITIEDALAHPTWKMGPKITVDSATLANKGLEVIEAHRLFGVPLDRVKVVLHRQSRVHAAVRTVDGTLHLEASTPDMRIPIQNALTYPDVLPSRVPWLDLAAGKLDFEPVDPRRYPMLDLAYRAARGGPALPIVYNAGDEAAVEAFRRDAIPYLRIPALVEELLSLAWPACVESVDAVLAVDREARARAAERLGTA